MHTENLADRQTQDLYNQVVEGAKALKKHAGVTAEQLSRGLQKSIDGISGFIDTVRPFVNEKGFIELPSIKSDPGDEQGTAYHIYHESRL